MKVLLDEMLPAGVVDLLTGHSVTTVKAAGFTGLSNGALIRGAVDAGYQVLLTADRNLPAQQNIPASRIAIVLVPGSRLADIGPRAIEILEAIEAAEPGSVTRLVPPG